MTSSPNQHFRSYIYLAVLKDLGYDVELDIVEDAVLNQLTY